MELEAELRLITSIKSLVRQSILYSQQAHDYAFKGNGLPAAIAYLQRACAKMASAEALYYAQFEVLERDEIEEIFAKFDIFSDELIEDFATDHSQQWTDIEFNNLKETFDNSALAFEQGN